MAGPILHTPLVAYLQTLFILLNFYITYRLLGIRKIEGKISKGNSSSSIIIPVRNNPYGIKRLINSLCKSRHELIIVDDESTDDTYLTALKECDKCRCKVIRVSKPPNWLGKTYACWSGYLFATKRKLIFIDSDTYVKEETIDTLCDALENHDVVSLVPRIRAAKTISAIFEYAFLIMSWLFYTPWKMVKKSRLWLAGAIMAWRKEAYEAVGGHKSVYNVIVEDVALARKAHDTGLRIAFYSLEGHYTDVDYNFRELIDFMTRVSFVVRINPSIYLAIASLGLLATTLTILSILTPNNLLSILYLISLYTPPGLIIAKGYLKGKPYTIILYPISYTITSVAGYIALKRLEKRDIKIKWRGREIPIEDIMRDI